jgi:2-dehydro-3-deoxyphosphogluconate aldolase/(4S)-4-hydroxy-2-oxoglutarate aldolase
VIAVLVIDDAQDALPLAQSLLRGGVRSIELTLRTDAALESIRRIRAELPEMTVGVGTILSPRQIDQVVQAGGSFGVSPGTNPRTIAAAKKADLPFAPGVCTPTDIELALESGCKILKYFPSEPCGGLGYLRSIAAPFEHLGVSFIPLGGVALSNAETYLREPLVHAIGGSWIAPRLTIRQRAWQVITENAAQATRLVAAVRDQKSAGDVREPRS